MHTPSRRSVLRWSAASVLGAAAACTSDDPDRADDSNGRSDDDSGDPTSTTGDAADTGAGGSFDADVIVVGAGISGLTAARDLVAGGKTVIVVEATDRIGGRIRTDRSLGVPFDIGASWIHGIGGNPITNLAKDAKAPWVELDFEDVSAYDVGGRKWTTAEWDAAQTRYEQLLETLSDSGKDGESFEAAVERVAPERLTNHFDAWFLSAYETFDTGDLDQLSSTLYDEGEVFEDPEVAMSDGYDRVTDHLATGLDLRRSTPVTKVSAETGSVALTTTTGTLRARHVVMTAPLGVMKAGVIAFDPPLPEAHLQAIEGIGFSAVDKFLFVWDRTFWDDTDFIAYTSERKDIFNWFANVNSLHPGSNALMTFAFADEARASESTPDEALMELVTTNLRVIYGPDTPAPKAMLRSKWVSEPFTRGAYTFTSVTTGMAQFDAIAEPVGALHFAGEHTSRDYFSTVHGAYLSGQRAAKEILDA